MLSSVAAYGRSCFIAAARLQGAQQHLLRAAYSPASWASLNHQQLHQQNQARSRSNSAFGSGGGNGASAPPLLMPYQPTSIDSLDAAKAVADEAATQNPARFDFAWAKARLQWSVDPSTQSDETMRQRRTRMMKQQVLQLQQQQMIQRATAGTAAATSDCAAAAASEQHTAVPTASCVDSTAAAGMSSVTAPAGSWSAYDEISSQRARQYAETITALRLQRR